MSQSQIFDIILIGFAVVILIHLFYNRDLFSSASSETMNNVEFPSLRDVYEDVIGDPEAKSQTDEKRTDAHAEVRDQGPLQQTDEAETPYYAVTNRTVDNNSVNSDADLSADDIAKEFNTKECNIQSDADNGYHKLCNNDKAAARKEQLGRRVRKNRSGEPKTYADDNKLIFPDNYEGRLTSDPYDADAVQVKKSGLDMQGFLGNNPFEEVSDASGEACNLDPEMKNLKRYIREYVLDGRDQCFCATDKSKSEFTRGEIDAYREQQIEFRDKINGTSALEHDPVDKMNEVTITGIKAKNQSIADFYDSVVENRYDRKGDIKLTHRVGNLDGPGFIMGTSVPSDDCIRSPEFDLEAPIPSGSYTRSANSGGRYFLRDNWMYTNENPNNGGLDATGVTGADPLMTSHLIVN